MAVVGKSLKSQQAHEEWEIPPAPINVRACPINKIHLQVAYQPTPFHQMEQVGQQLILLSKWWRKKYCQKPQITTRINSLTKSSWDTLTLTAITFFPSSFILLPVVRFPHSPFFIHVSLLIVRKGQGGGGTGGSKPPTYCISFSGSRQIFIDFPSSALFWLQNIKQFSADSLCFSRFLPFEETHRPLFSLSILPPPPWTKLHTHLLIN